jgi:hypothetical protein
MLWNWKARAIEKASQHFKMKTTKWKFPECNWNINFHHFQKEHFFAIDSQVSWNMSNIKIKSSIQVVFSFTNSWNIFYVSKFWKIKKWNKIWYSNKIKLLKLNEWNMFWGNLFFDMWKSIVILWKEQKFQLNNIPESSLKCNFWNIFFMSFLYSTS